jgi:hypothetical protein
MMTMFLLQASKDDDEDRPRKKTAEEREAEHLAELQRTLRCRKHSEEDSKDVFCLQVNKACFCHLTDEQMSTWARAMVRHHLLSVSDNIIE